LRYNPVSSFAYNRNEWMNENVRKTKRSLYVLQSGL
jgi:hypothetical protein